mmetsp:Transcript_15779/g.34210  ORF Transcript_15779/g.34210 Transcript_15779/m.34210 type:complete len:173 (-) Transcript_15779:210-728(-)
MFFQVSLERDLSLHPRHFGPKMREVLRANLKNEVEGTCDGKNGYIVLVTKIHDAKPGVIKEGSGWAAFHLTYDCIVFRPFKGEILECVVKEVNKFGFFAEAGPQQVFVSELLIPNDFQFCSVDEPCFQSSDGLDRIRKDSEVRLKIVGTCIENTEIKCIGSIKDNYLGLISE